MSVSDWLGGRVFDYVHGNNLVYNTCWEDPRLDREALDLGPDDTLLVITSAGCNALDYVLTGLKHVHAVDMNPRQNALLELKKAAIRQLDFDEFFKMFGEGRLPGVKDVYRTKLRAELDPASRRYWDGRIKRYFDHKRKTFYFRGTSGMFAYYMNRFYIDRYARLRPHINAMVDATDFEEQRRIYHETIRDRFWKGPVRFVMNRDATLSLLGVPRAQRAVVETQYDGKIVNFVQDCLDTVFGELPLQDNYFWRVYITGSYTRECCPEYLKEENFQKLKDGMVDRVTTHTDTVEGFLRSHDGEISRYVLLDHMDWLCDKLFEALEAEWQAIVDHAAPKTRIIWRSGGLKTDFLDRVEVDVNGHRYRLPDILVYHPELADRLHDQCRVHTYGSFYIADLNLPA